MGAEGVYIAPDQLSQPTARVMQSTRHDKFKPEAEGLSTTAAPHATGVHVLADVSKSSIVTCAHTAADSKNKRGKKEKRFIVLRVKKMNNYK